MSFALEGWRKENPKLTAWAEENLPEGFAVFDVPPEHRVRIHTTNNVKRLNKEIKRRTHVATLLPNSASCLQEKFHEHNYPNGRRFGQESDLSSRR